MKRSPVLLPLLASFLPVCVQADVGTEVDRLLTMSMDDVMALKVRISTNTDQTLSKAPSVVSVITAEDMAATGATNLTEVLQSVPGIYVRPNLFGFRPLITFRGAASTHTLLMVNGVPMRDLVWSSGIFWKGLPTHMIERVEIIRGPGSALFGSDASAGVINVITRTAGRIEQDQAGLGAGSFDSQAGWMQYGGQWNGMEIGLTAQLSRTDGHDPWIAADGQTALGGSYAPTHAHYGWNGQDLRFSAASGNWRLLADYTGHSDLQTAMTGAAVVDPVTAGNDYRFDLGLLYANETFAPDWGIDAELRYRQLGYASGDGFQERPPGFTCLAAAGVCTNLGLGVYPAGLINRQRSAERGATFEISGLYTGLKKHAIRLGGGYNWEDLFMVEHHVNYGRDASGAILPAGGPLVDISDSDYAFAPELHRRITYVYAQDIWTIADGLELTAGLRLDHYSDFGNALNPRLALVWQATDRLTAKLLYGEAFRAPSILELFSKTSSVMSNPNLEPEESSTWDLSFAYAATRDLGLGLGLYKFAQTNLISNVAGQYQNSGDSSTYGVELEARWQATDNWRVSASVAHMNTALPTAVSLTAPEDKAYLRSDWSFLPRWNWNVQATWIGERTLAGRAPLDAYALVDTTLRYAPRKRWQWAASIRNLFDVDAYDYTSSAVTNNLPLPGRSLHAEVAYRF
ncbi:MAG: TonB-dependent receptor [Thiobacillus sp.]|nr:TonB-dependent receptor [Thiobacillus sp.]